MPNAREITLMIDGEQRRIDLGDDGYAVLDADGRGVTYCWGDDYTVEMTRDLVEAVVDRIVDLENTLKLRTTELETARAEATIYRAQRDQVSAETTIDEERFHRLFDAVRDEHVYTVGRHVAREVLSRYLAEMTAMKPARDLHDVPPVSLGDDTP